MGPGGQGVFRPVSLIRRRFGGSKLARVCCSETQTKTEPSVEAANELAGRLSGRRRGAAIPERRLPDRRPTSDHELIGSAAKNLMGAAPPGCGESISSGSNPPIPTTPTCAAGKSAHPSSTTSPVWARSAAARCSRTSARSPNSAPPPPGKSPKSRASARSSRRSCTHFCRRKRPVRTRLRSLAQARGVPRRLRGRYKSKVAVRMNCRGSTMR